MKSNAQTPKAIKVSTTLGNFRFRGSPEKGRVVVVCRGLGKIRMTRVNKFSGTLWEAVTVPATLKKGDEVVALGGNAKQCYKNALNTFWL